MAAQLEERFPLLRGVPCEKTLRGYHCAPLPCAPPLRPSPAPLRGAPPLRSSPVPLPCVPLPCAGPPPCAPPLLTLLTDGSHRPRIRLLSPLGTG